MIKDEFGRQVILVNFYGHTAPVMVGTEGSTMVNGQMRSSVGRIVKRDLILNVISEADFKSLYPNEKKWIYDYNSGLSISDHCAVSSSVYDRVLNDHGQSTKFSFLLTGYSIGGINAIYMARYLKSKQANVAFLALVDAAFQRGETDKLIAAPEVDAERKYNIYQTKENGASNDEIHGAVTGFQNSCIDDKIPWLMDPHDAAIILGNVMAKCLLKGYLVNVGSACVI